MVKEIEDFKKEVLSAKVPVLVDFWAPWCGPCMQLAPIFERLSDEFAGKLKFLKLNVDSNQQVAGELGIRGIPCLIVFNSGKEIDRFVGFHAEDELRSKLDLALAK